MGTGTDPRVAAVRKDPAVGEGSCSSIDECYSDADLVRELDDNRITTAEEAIAWARQGEELFLEKGLNQRWGEDSDPQLKMMREFKERCQRCQCGQPALEDGRCSACFAADGSENQS